MSKHSKRRASHDVERLSSQLDDLYQTMLISTTRTVQFRTRGGAPRGWRPSIDVYEADGELHVVAEIAGVHDHDISVALDNDTLRIRGERSPVCGDPTRSIHEMGILYGPFAADVYLPFAVEPESVEASYDNGLLHVRLQRVAPTQISVSYGES